MNEYDPSRPNEYELFCAERQTLKDQEKRLQHLREGMSSFDPIYIQMYNIILIQITQSSEWHMR